MRDVVFVATLLVFFGACTGLIRSADRVVGAVEAGEVTSGGETSALVPSTTAKASAA